MSYIAIGTSRCNSEYKTKKNLCAQGAYILIRGSGQQINKIPWLLGYDADQGEKNKARKEKSEC